ncbi:MAG: FkbM family methyltransferase [Flavobacteriaceae bacterium]|nr:FkbM family methyltransferase [Flavobacteriaceae bacterium]
MKSLLATLFKLLFKIPFLKHYFFAIHKRVFAPLNLFKGVVKRVRFKKNIILELHIDDWIPKNIYFTGTYEEAELQYIQSSLKKEDVFVDVGANIGVHSLFASKIVGNKGQVISFEPFNKNHQSFKKNIKINDISNIIAENLAVSESDTFIDIYYNKDELNLGMVSAFITNYSDSQKAETISLDSYFEKNHINKVDFIKIDIEGGEYNALLGMKKTLVKYSPKLLIEILDESNPSLQNNKEHIIFFLKKIGYNLYFIDDDGELSVSIKNDNRMNFAFIKD